MFLANGTFINFSLKRLSKGERLELKSGDEIFLLNPRHYVGNENDNVINDNATSFMFFNMRDRLFDQREITTAPPLPSALNVVSETPKQHIEDVYVIGDRVGAGTCGQVYKCIHRVSGKQYAVKIIDTTKFSRIAGLSINELREEADMMKQLDHVSINYRSR
jgi:serine/threonine protein kinase